MRNYLFYLFAFISISCVFTDEITKDEGVLVLTNDNFEKAMADHEHILVEFYAPWCGHCKALAPEYAAAAKQLEENGSEVKLGKVDATVEKALAEKFEISGYPTLKFFARGKEPSAYRGGRTANDIVNWLQRKVSAPVTEVTTVAQFDKLKGESDCFVLAISKEEKNDMFDHLTKLADQFEDVVFGKTNDKDVIESLNVEKDTVIVFRKMDEGREVLTDDLSLESITLHVQGNRLPLVVEFNEETAQKIFGGPIKDHLLFFLSKKSSDYSEQMDSLKTVAKKYKGKVFFVIIDTDNVENERVLEFFGLKATDAPTLRLVNVGEDLSRYAPEFKGIVLDEIEKFVDTYLKGELSPTLLSDEVPEDWDAKPVKVLVGKNFEEVAMNKETTVMIEFYAPWCGHCKALAPIWEQLAEKFKDSKDVVIAKMDSTTNEVSSVKVKSFPTLRLVAKDTNEIIAYNGERTLEGLTKFVESNGAVGGGNAEEEPEDEQDEEEPLPEGEDDDGSDSEGEGAKTEL
ncbi:hypothetical protein SNEBB_005420 [Seison nebaliae]|nr:hypothetical protein SNEBB_005420 [Seison nebaliae]